MLEPRDINAYAAAERRLISVVEDRELVEMVVQEREPKSLVQKVRHHTQKFLFGGMLGQAETIIKAIETLQSYLEKKGQKVMAVSISEANQLIFPPGHPSVGSVYGIHPTDNKMYYPVIDFHRLNFQSKYAEAIKLLARLGANKISVRHVQGWNLDFSSNATVSTTEAEIEAEAERKESAESSTYTEIEYAGHDNPLIPDDLHWYQYEPIWIAIAEGRIKDKMKNFKLLISYNDDYGISGTLNANILKSGFKTSGKFTEQVNTTWSIEGEFGQRVE